MNVRALLLEAADIIERNAAAMAECHTIGGEWPKSEAEVKEAYEQEMDTVGRLRESARIFDPKNWKLGRRQIDAERTESLP